MKAVEDVSCHRQVAFDAEGVDLGRDGPLTVASFSGLEDKTVYVIDVQTIGGDRVFSPDLPSFRELLENGDITKVVFDCRGDSDALFHQFGVKLAGVRDVQVLDQAVRIHQGEAPPQRCPYATKGGIPYLQSMKNVSERNLPSSSAEKLAAPSCTAWEERPISALALEYAANDVYIIKTLWNHLQRVRLPYSLRDGVKSHCQRYEGMFRDRDNAVHRTRDKDFIMEEHPIVACGTLPNSHPRMLGPSASQAVQKWHDVVRQLKAKNGGNILFDKVIFILQHNYWYTKEAFVVLRRLAADCPFTRKQRAMIEKPPKFRVECDDDF